MAAGSHHHPGVVGECASGRGIRSRIRGVGAVPRSSSRRWQRGGCRIDSWCLDWAIPSGEEDEEEGEEECEWVGEWGCGWSFKRRARGVGRGWVGGVSQRTPSWWGRDFCTCELLASGRGPCPSHARSSLCRVWNGIARKNRHPVDYIPTPSDDSFRTCRNRRALSFSPAGGKIFYF